MKDLFAIATGQDTAGWNWRIAGAMNRQAEGWEARSMAVTETYLQYPVDLPWDLDDCIARYAAADVIHLQNQAAGWELYDRGAGKPTVLQHHGTIFREGHEAISRSARKIGLVEICSTIDLTLYEPGVEWIGVPYRRSELMAFRDAHKPDGVIRIGHAPTNRDVKGTDHFLAVMDKLAERYRVETVLIEREPWATCLERKARCDIFYDQLELGYGSNAVEAWGMGIPVVAGTTDPAVRSLMVSRWGRLPFVEATSASLEKALSLLIGSSSMRSEYSVAGGNHFDRWHDERAVAPMLVDVYASAKPTRPGPDQSWRDRKRLRRLNRVLSQ